MAETKDYLTPEMSPRGFARMPTIADVTVYESSAAEGPHIWLQAGRGDDAATVHLTAETAWRISEQIQTLVRNHYQGDASPGGES